MNIKKEENLECSELIQKIETNPIKKKKTAVSFGCDERILLTGMDHDIWEEVDTEEEIDKFKEEDDFKEEEEVKETNYKKHVIIDVGGERHQACRDSLTRYPQTRLGKLVNLSNIEEILSLCEEYVPGDPPEFFFDRNPESFAAVLEMYRSGKFHIPDNGKSCAMVMRRDFLYWGLEELNLEACCALKFYPQVDVCTTQLEGEIAEKLKEEEEKISEEFGDSKIAQKRTWIWDFLEKPWTSSAAQVYALSSLGVILVSTVIFIVSTFEELQVDKDGNQAYPDVIFAIEVLDLITVVIFTVEYFIRLICSPVKWKFFIKPMNLVDFIALLPFFISMILEELEDYQIIGKAGKIIRLMKVMRIFRVYKLFRHFAGLQSLLYTLQQAYKELGLLMFIVGIGILTFSSLVYICETGMGPSVAVQWKNQTIFVPQNNTWTFLDCFWWGTLTITTVGHDSNPKTFLGQIFGGFCALLGVFTLTLPIPIVVNSFAGFYKNRLWRNEVAQKKRERVQAQEEGGYTDMGVEQNEAEDINKIRRNNEMTVADMINLSK